MCKKVHSDYLKVKRGKQFQMFGSIKITKAGRELELIQVFLQGFHLSSI